MKRIDDVAEALKIDIEFSSPSLLNQQNLNIIIFITFFEKIHLVKTIITNFANYFFEYIITRNNPNLNYCKSESFTYITLKRYTVDKFC